MPKRRSFDPSSQWQRLVRFIEKDLWEANLTASDRRRRVLLGQLRVAVLVGQGSLQHQISLHAAALTYITVFSLVPTLAVGFAIFKAFGGLETAMQTLLPTLLDYLAVGTRDVVAERIESAVRNVHGGAIGGIGGLFLAVSAISLLRNIEHSFNSIWGVKHSRGFFQTVTTYWTMATITPALLLAGISLSAAVRNVFALQWALEEIPLLRLGLSVVIPLVLVCLGFSLLYAFMPNTKVSLRAALIGGIAGGALWSAAVYGYAVYAARAVQYSAIYGSLGVIPILLLWIYLTWIIVLVGGEIAFAQEHVESYGEEIRAREASLASRQLLALRLLGEVSRRFLAAEPPPGSSELAHDLHSPRRLVNEISDELVEIGFLCRTDAAEKLVPGRDPNRIHPGEVLRALRRRGTTGSWPRRDSMTKALESRLEEAERASDSVWRDVTLADLTPALETTG